VAVAAVKGEKFRACVMMFAPWQAFVTGENKLGFVCGVLTVDVERVCQLWTLVATICVCVQIKGVQVQRIAAACG